MGAGMGDGSGGMRWEWRRGRGGGARWGQGKGKVRRGWVIQRARDKTRQLVREGERAGFL